MSTAAKKTVPASASRKAIGGSRTRSAASRLAGSAVPEPLPPPRVAASAAAYDVGQSFFQQQAPEFSTRRLISPGVFAPPRDQVGNVRGKSVNYINPSEVVGLTFASRPEFTGTKYTSPSQAWTTNPAMLSSLNSVAPSIRTFTGNAALAGQRTVASGQQFTIPRPSFVSPEAHTRLSQLRQTVASAGPALFAGVAAAPSVPIPASAAEEAVAMEEEEGSEPESEEEFESEEEEFEESQIVTISELLNYIQGLPTTSASIPNLIAIILGYSAARGVSPLDVQTAFRSTKLTNNGANFGNALSVILGNGTITENERKLLVDFIGKNPDVGAYINANPDIFARFLRKMQPAATRTTKKARTTVIPQGVTQTVPTGHSHRHGHGHRHEHEHGWQPQMMASSSRPTTRRRGTFGAAF